MSSRSGQDGLFSADLIPGRGESHRSVGELLNQADSAARHLLASVDAPDAGPLVNAFPDLLASTVALWNEVPDRRTTDQATTSREAIRPLAARIPEFRTRDRNIGWLASKEKDPRVVDLAHQVDQIRDHLRLYGESGQARAGRGDNVEAARVLAMHVVLVVSHAVAASIRKQIKEADDSVPPRVDQLWRRRVRAAGREVEAGRIPQAVVGQAQVAKLAVGIAAERFGITPQEILSPSHSRDAIEARAVATWVAWRAGLDSHAIAAAFGREPDHVDKTINLAAQRPNLRAIADDLASTIRKRISTDPVFVRVNAEQRRAELRLLDRLGRVEGLAQSYVAGRYAAATAGDELPVPETGRLHRALLNFDATTHRVLSAPHSSADVLLITQTEALTAAAALRIIGSATDAATDNLGDPLQRAAKRWAEVGELWRDIASPAQRIDPRLASNAAEVRTALRETIDAMDSDPDFTAAERLRASRAVLWALEQGHEVSVRVGREAERPDLVAPARAMSRQAQQIQSRSNQDVVWVSPEDIHAKRMVPLPRPVADLLRRRNARLITAAHDVASNALRAQPPPRGEPQAATGVALMPRHERIKRDLEALHHSPSSYVDVAR